ncbi:MAG: MCE family protein [Bryobacterales bacterium]|nr:MCE family protein [Bryobacterales bacterium]
MPSEKKVSWAQLRVGIVAAVAMIILTVLIFLLTGSGTVFTSTATVRTFMSDSAGMASGAPVRLNGIPIGNIKQPRLTGSKDPRRVVEIPMEVRSEYLREIPIDSVASVTASNLLGDKFINITKGKSAQHIREGGEIRSLEAQDIPELVSQSSSLLEQLKVSIARIDAILADVEAGRGNVGKFFRDEELYRRLNATIAEAQKAVAAVTSGQGTIGRLIYDDKLYEEIRAPVRRLDEVLAGIQRGEGSAGKFLKDPALYDDARKAVAQLNRVMEDLNAGRGTAGKLLKDEQFYNRLNDAIAQLNNLLEGVNSGRGTLGQLAINPQLYESLNGATRELNQLVRDVRADPRKYLRIKLSLF